MDQVSAAGPGSLTSVAPTSRAVFFNRMRVHQMVTDLEVCATEIRSDGFGHLIVGRASLRAVILGARLQPEEMKGGRIKIRPM